MHIIKPFLSLVFGFNLLAILAQQPAVAESVTMVKDIDQQASWKILSSVSNDSVAFHFRRVDSTQIPTLWRSTENETVEVDLSAIRTNGAGVLDDFYTLTENYLYVWNGHGELWQIAVDSLQARQVALDSVSTVENYSEVIRDHVNGAFYFLVEDSGPLATERGLRLYKLDEGTPAIRLVSTAVIPQGFIFQDSIVLGEQIIFHGSNGVWRISTTGENPENISEAQVTNGRDEMVAGRSLAYFHVLNLRRSANDNRPLTCNIWRTDGTKAGTYALTSCDVGAFDPPPNSYPSYNYYNTPLVDTEITITRNNQAVFKKINWNTDRIELWKTNGTRASTVLVKSFPYVRVPGNLNPESMRIDLRRAGEFIWYKSYARNRRHVVSVSDLSLGNTKRIMAGRLNAVINLMGFSDHVLIQQVYNGSNFNNITSALYRADANGDGLSRISYGRSFLPGDFNDNPDFRIGRVVKIANQILLPYKVLKQSRELLLAHNLDTGKTSVRQRWNEPTDSSMRGSYLTTGSNNTAWFCANNGDTSRWQAGNQNRLWVSDGSSANTRAVIADIGSVSSTVNDFPFIRSECGQFVISGDRIVFTRKNASLGDELWIAKIDGSEQKPLLDLRPGGASSSPRQLVATSRGVIFTAFPDQFGNNNETPWNPKQLVRVNNNGSHEVLFNGSSIRILKQTGDSVWFRSHRSLAVTDGTNAGTRILMNAVTGANVAEINGTTYVAITFFNSIQNPPALYRLSANSTRLVRIGSIQAAFESSLARPGDMIGYKDHLYVLEGSSFSKRIFRYDPSTDEATKVFDLEATSPTLRFIRSIAVFDDSIYAYVEVTTETESDGRWEIWRSGGEPGDFVPVHSEREVIPRLFSSLDDDTIGKLTPSESSLWFMARDQVHGVELWQLKPD